MLISKCREAYLISNGGELASLIGSNASNVDVAEPGTERTDRAISYKHSRKTLNNDLLRLGIFWEISKTVTDQRSCCYQILLAITARHDT